MQRFTLEEFKKIHSEWKDSGLRIQDFCANTGIKESRFYYWKKRVEAGVNLPSPIGGFIPVKASGKTGRLANAFATSVPSDILCELVYQNGVTLRVTSDMTLEQLRAMVLFGDTETSEQLEVTAPDEVADLMRPLYYKVQDFMLGMAYLQSDESTLPVINDEKHRAVKGYIWLMRSIQVPMVCFHYHDGSRSSEVALGFFRKFKGVIQVDGYAGYDVLDKLADVDFRKWTTYFLQHIHEYDDDYSKDLADFFPHILKEKSIV